jgi:GTP-binding protein EngB required for normal cell division
MTGRRGQVTSIATRAAAIDDALNAAGAYLDPDLVQRAGATIDRALERLELGSRHTVVALVGATGSGKSSLFNALAGLEIAEVGARRPMTREPMAAIWGEGGDAVLDWLDVPPDRRMRRESVLDADRQAPLHGLILLDLPDHDSTETVHAVAVDRLVGMVDLMVWVVDPQKYADDALHSRYLQKLTAHEASMIIVLNQIDRLAPGEAQTCIGDLRRLLDGDGLTAVHQLAISARTGDGVEDLRQALAQVVRGRGAVVERVAADLQQVTEEISASLGPPGTGRSDTDLPGADQLVEHLSNAAGVPAVVDALASEYRRRGWQRIGWPLLTWLRRLTPDAIGRLRSSVDDHDLRVIATSLMPGSTPAHRAEVTLAVHAVADASATGLPPRWAAALRAAADSPGAPLVPALDDAVADVSLALSPPIWWRGVQALQYALTAAALVGVIWLFALGASGLSSTPLEPPAVTGLPLSLPMVMLLAGTAGGALLAALSGWALAIGATRRRADAEDQLLDAVERVADDVVLRPIREVLAVHDQTWVALAGGGNPPVPAMIAQSVADDAGARLPEDGAQPDDEPFEFPGGAEGQVPGGAEGQVPDGAAGQVPDGADGQLSDGARGRAAAVPAEHQPA